MKNWVATLTGETQSHMLALLRRAPRSITALAKALRLTDNAVRSHIAVLRRDGIVQDVGVQRETGGKPARLYGLTRAGEELFPKAYHVALGSLIDEIKRREGRDRVVELLRAVGRRAAGGKRGDIEAAATMLRSLGADVDVQRTSTGWRLQGYACPFSAVTAEREELCELVRALVAEIVEQPVSECCERNGHARCAFAVEA